MNMFVLPHRRDGYTQREGIALMNIMPNDLGRQYSLHAAEYEEKALQVLRSGWYVLGKEVEAFEKEWAEYIGAKHCVGLASGLDALCKEVESIIYPPAE